MYCIICGESIQSHVDENGEEEYCKCQSSFGKNFNPRQWKIKGYYTENEGD